MLVRQNTQPSTHMKHASGKPHVQAQVYATQAAEENLWRSNSMKIFRHHHLSFLLLEVVVMVNGTEDSSRPAAGHMREFHVINKQVTWIPCTKSVIHVKFFKSQPVRTKTC